MEHGLSIWFLMRLTGDLKKGILVYSRPIYGYYGCKWMLLHMVIYHVPNNLTPKKLPAIVADSEDFAASSGLTVAARLNLFHFRLRSLEPKLKCQSHINLDPLVYWRFFKPLD